MGEADVGEDSWSPFPYYDLSSTGSLHLIELRERCPSTVLEFEGEHRRQTFETSVRQRVAQGFSKAWSSLSWKQTVMSHVPIVQTLMNYKVSRDLVNDLVAGLTVGVMMIPQGMAFALVATLPPIIGLYMAFFSSIVYIVLGTAHHLSWNCVAVLAIMIGNLLDTYDTQLRQTLLVNTTPLSNRTPAHLPPAVFGAPNTTASPHSDISGQSSAVLHQALAFSLDDPEAITRFGAANEMMSPTPLIQVSDVDTNHSAVTDSVRSVSQASQLEKDITAKKLELASSVTLLSGLILAVLGKLGLGRLAAFMSDSLVISFMVGVSFHVLVGQLDIALGLDLPAHNGVFKIFTHSVDIITHLNQTNLANFITFALCALIIYVIKRFVNEKYANKLKVPVPVELIVVILATAVNSYVKMNETHSVSIVEDIPVGIPKPKLPDISMGVGYLSEGLIIIVISFTQTVALGKIMALKHNYRIDCNLEMFSLGTASVVCSLFSGFIPGASITCTIILDSSGGKTQLASLFSSGLVLLVVMFLGPYFYHLPLCVLAAIVIVNIRSMFLKLLTIPALWRKSRADAIVWISTCAATVILDTDLGLLVGMAVCVTGVLVRSRILPVSVLGQVTIDNVHLWKPVDKYYGAEELPNIKVVGINSDFYFVNADLITAEIMKMTGINPSSIKRKGVVLLVDQPNTANTDNQEAVLEITENSDTGNTDTTSQQENSTFHHHADNQRNATSVSKTDKIGDAVSNGNHHQAELPFTTLVMDFGGVTYIDLTAVSALNVLIADYEAVGVRVFLTHLHERCVHVLKATGFLDNHSDRVFVNTAAALSYTRQTFW